MEQNNSILEINNINKTYKNSRALSEVSFFVEKGEMVGLIGSSGSGKSTLLRLISGLIKSDKSGSYIKVFQTFIQKNGTINSGIRKIRAKIGFVFQKFNLVERMSVIKNVLVGALSRMPFWRSWLQIFTRSEKILAMEALQRVNIDKYALQRSGTLSGGQQQRAAIARALVQKAEIILADEPIASLDPEASRKVMKILSKINREDNTTVIISLHQVEYALDYCKRIIALKEGKIIFDGAPEELTVEMLHSIYGSEFNETGTCDEGYECINISRKKKTAIKNIKKDLTEVKAYI
ncbi:MAG: phosphonate ABC transporter ATP-binding protein [Spirochaetes bacterium]|nr:phosphonate ABC transporter ATP-binding protein [Spirochaetota bacterium]